jgi:hypothetical protein
VGETPTAGVNKEQFRNAVKIIQEIQEGSLAAEDAKKPPLLILGPSFSGSFRSQARGPRVLHPNPTGN